MPGLVYVLTGESPLPVDYALCKLADFMGLKTELVSVPPCADECPGQLRTLPADSVLAVSQAALRQAVGQDWLRGLLHQVRSALFFGFSPADGELLELKWLTGNVLRAVRSLPCGRHTVRVHSNVRSQAFPVSGQSYVESLPAPTFFEFGADSAGAEIQISIDDCPYFVSVPSRGGFWFFLAEEHLVDLDAAVPERASLRDWYPHLTGVAMFLRRSCGSSCWTAPVTPANFMVDDPYLKRRYGFLRYEAVLGALAECGGALTVGFIPYNYTRSDPGTVAFLRARHARFSIAIHGCDHTEGEFSGQDQAWLDGTASCALERMERHADLTGMPYDNVMVFPKGLFSIKAIRALKRCGYSAVVNSTAWPIDHGPNSLTVRDHLSPAITRWETFPIFIRRYPQELFDYAFDALFQKPILVVEHHSFFREGCERLRNVVEKLSGLSPQPAWMPLGRALESSCLLRKATSGDYVLRHFASVLRFKNPAADKLALQLEKPEQDQDVDAVLAGGQKLSFAVSSGMLGYKAQVGPGEELLARVVHRPSPSSKRTASRKYRVGVSVRRLLSEFRDNEIARSRWILAMAEAARRVLGPQRTSERKVK